MKRVLNFLLFLLFLTILMPLWQINVGITIFGYQIVGLIFLVLYVFNIMYKRVIPNINKRLYIFIWLITLLLIAKMLSIFGALSAASQSYEYMTQYGKGMLFEIFSYALLISSILHLNSIDYESRNRIMNSFLIIVLFACFYHFIQLTYLALFRVDLNQIIWPLISYNADMEVSTALTAGVIGNEQITWYRVGGFLGNPNAFASVLIIALSFMWASYIKYKSKLYLIGLFIISLSLLMTLSRSGLLGFSILFVIMSVIYIKRQVFNVFKLALLLASIILIILLLFSDEVYSFISLRFFEVGLGPRADLFLAAVQSISESPILGYGYNNSPLVLDNYDVVSIAGRDFHNYFLIKLVELGLFGFIVHIIFLTYMVLQLNHKDLFNFSSIVALIALLFMNVFNNTLSNMYTYFFIYLLYAVSIINLKDIKKIGK